MVTQSDVAWVGLALLSLFFLAQYADARKMTRGPATVALTVRRMVATTNAWIRDFLTLTRTTLLAFGLLGSIFLVFPWLIGLDPFAWAGVLSFIFGIGNWLGFAEIGPFQAAGIILALFLVLWVVVQLVPTPSGVPSGSKARRR